MHNDYVALMYVEGSSNPAQFDDGLCEGYVIICVSVDLFVFISVSHFTSDCMITLDGTRFSVSGPATSMLSRLTKLHMLHARYVMLS